MEAWFTLLAIVSFYSLWSFRTYISRAELPVCVNCRYSLEGLPATARCPECNGVERQKHTVRRRVRILFRLRRIPLVVTVFVLVPPLWIMLNVAGTTWAYARVEGFTAAWRNASVGLETEYEHLGWAFDLLAPIAAAIALASIYWSRRARWWVAGALLLLLAWIAFDNGMTVPSWHRRYERLVPDAAFVLIAAALLSLRAILHSVDHARANVFRR